MEAMRATLEEIKAVVSREKAARDQKRQERHEKYEDVLNQVKSDLSVGFKACYNIPGALKSSSKMRLHLSLSRALAYGPNNNEEY